MLDIFRQKRAEKQGKSDLRILISRLQAYKRLFMGIVESLAFIVSFFWLHAEDHEAQRTNQGGHGFYSQILLDRQCSCVRRFTRNVTENPQCLYYIQGYVKISTLTTTLTFATKTYHFTLVTEWWQFFAPLVAKDLYLSRLRMDADSRRTFWYTIWRLSNVSSYSLTWYQGCISIYTCSEHIVSGRLMWHCPRISVGHDLLFFIGSFPNLSFSVSEMAVFLQRNWLAF